MKRCSKHWGILHSRFDIQKDELYIGSNFYIRLSLSSIARVVLSFTIVGCVALQTCNIPKYEKKRIHISYTWIHFNKRCKFNILSFLNNFRWKNQKRIRFRTLKDTKSTRCYNFMESLPIVRCISLHLLIQCSAAQKYETKKCLGHRRLIKVHEEDREVKNLEVNLLLYTWRVTKLTPNTIYYEFFSKSQNCFIKHEW